MKPEIDRPEKIAAWLKNPLPAVFHGQDLDPTPRPSPWRPWTAALPGLRDGAGAGQGRRGGGVPRRALDGRPALRPVLAAASIRPRDLYDKFDPDAADPTATYRQCLDWLVYESVVEPITRWSGPSTSTWF